MRCEPGPLCAPVCSGGASGEDCRGGGFGGLSAGFPLSQSSLKSAGLRRAAALRYCFSWGRAWCTRGLWLRLCAQTGGVCSQCRLRGASQVNEKWGGRGGGREREGGAVRAEWGGDGGGEPRSNGEAAGWVKWERVGGLELRVLPCDSRHVWPLPGREGATCPPSPGFIT